MIEEHVQIWCGILAEVMWGKLHSFECWHQIQSTVHAVHQSMRQPKGWDWKPVKKEVGLRTQQRTLHCIQLKMHKDWQIHPTEKRKLGVINMCTAPFRTDYIKHTEQTRQWSSSKQKRIYKLTSGSLQRLGKISNNQWITIWTKLVWAENDEGFL